MSITPATSLAEIATTIPAAARVFERHRLDFCCRGARTLGEACAARQLDPAAITAEIAAALPLADERRWDDEPLAALVAHIVERHHHHLRRELPRLVTMAAKVERVHAGKPDCPAGLADHLRDVAAAVESHLGKEEQVLFPMIVDGHGSRAGMPVRVMMQEHDDHGVALARTRALTADLAPPAAACATWRALYLGLGELEADLHRHIHLENNVLFPRALRA